MPGGYDGSIRINSNIITAGFNHGVQAISAGLEKTTGGLKRLAGAVGLAFGGAALVRFAQAAISTASDISEVQNVVDTAFGEMAYKAEDFASRAIEQFGMSELAAKKTASTYMAMSGSMGLSAEAASDMAIDVAGLTGDIASFYNISQELAGVKLKAIWTGETEGLKDLGVVMTQTNLQAFALAQGITEDIAKMTQAEQVTLRYKYVTEQLGLARGDFAKTSDSWANQTRILSERFKELLGILGNGLIAALTPGLQLLNQLVSKLIDFSNALSSSFHAVFGSTEEEGKNAGSAIDGAVDSTDDLTSATDKATKAAQKAVAGFDELNKLSAGGGSDTADGGIITELPTGGDKTIKINVEVATEEATRKFADTLLEWKTMAEPTAEAFRRLVDALGPIKTFSAKGAQDFYEKFLRPLATWTLGEGLPRLLDTTKNLASSVNWSGLNDSLSRLWSALEPLAEQVGEGLLWFYENVITPMAGWALSDLTPAALDLITAALDALGSIIDVMSPMFLWIWEDFLQPLGAWSGEMVIDAIEWITARLTDFSNWVRENHDAIQTIATVIIGFLEGLLIYDTISFMMHIVTNFGKCSVAMLAISGSAGVAKTSLSKFGSALFAVGGSAGFAKISLGLLYGAAALVMGAWDDMSGVERAISVIALLAAGCIAAFIAVGALSSALSMGVAAIAIGAGVIAIIASARAAEQAAKSMQESTARGAGRDLPKVPRLASGAVIPPNAEFLAVLGDQKQGRNFEAPEGLLRQIVREELNGFQGASGKTDVSIHFSGSLSQLGRVLKPVIDVQTSLAGPKSVGGGRR